MTALCLVLLADLGLIILWRLYLLVTFEVLNGRIIRNRIISELRILVNFLLDRREIIKTL